MKPRERKTRCSRSKVKYFTDVFLQLFTGIFYSPEIMCCDWRSFCGCERFFFPHHTGSRAIQTEVRVAVAVTGNAFSKKQTDGISVVTWSTFLHQHHTRISDQICIKTPNLLRTSLVHLARVSQVVGGTHADFYIVRVAAGGECFGAL